MMKKYTTLRYIYAVVLFIMVGWNGFAQEQPSPSLLPNITPPSPEPFSITKYGDVPIDEFNGKVNLSIPIYEYKAGQLKLPININYNGAGIKVKDIPTQVGMNWSMNAGGVISREVRDMADETATRYIFTQAQLLELNKQDCSNEAATLRGYIDNLVDTEMDLFNFNFSGYSGSFYLDETMTPRLTKNDAELRIQIIGNLNTDKEFLIIDPTGVKYYFGGTSAIEYSSSETNVNTGGITNSGGVTSFYLYKIVHPVNGIINIEYETKANYNYVLNTEWTRTMSMADEMPMNCQTPGPSSSSSMTKNFVAYPKYIKKISSPNIPEEVAFSRIDLNQSNPATAFKTAVRIALKSIVVKNNEVTTHKVDLDYLGIDNVNSVKRFFLSKVEFNNTPSLPGKNEVYRFEYNDPNGLPETNSYKIDKLGYFNNKPNQNLTPCFPGDNSLFCPDRSSNFNYASKGVLNKVVYPTKGYTQFEYEQQPHVEKKYTMISGQVYTSTSQLEENDGAIFANGRYTKLHDELPKTITNPDNSQTILFETPLLFGDQTVDITLSTDLTTSDLNYQRDFKTRITITDLTPGSDYGTSEWKESSSGQNALVYKYKFKSGRIYKIDLDLKFPTAIPADNDYSAAGRFSFDIHTGYHAPTGYGVRVKSTKDFTADQATPLMKRYYYKAYHKIDDIHADNLIIPEIARSSAWVMNCDFFNLVIRSTTKSSEINYMDFTFNTSLRDYTNVCISYGGDAFEQGGFEKTFAFSEPGTSFTLNSISPRIHSLPDPDGGRKSNPSPINGTLIKEKTFKKTGNTVYKINEKKYDYEYPIVASKINIFGNQLYPYFPGNVFETIKVHHFPYSHSGWFDCLNPDYTNRCNCCIPSEYNQIDEEVRRLMKNKLILDNDPLADFFDAALGSGFYRLERHFNAYYTEVEVVLQRLKYVCYQDRTLSNYYIGNYATNTYDFKKVTEKEVNYIIPVPANLVAHEASEMDDPTIVYPTQDQLEAAYQKITTQQEYEYGTLRGLPTRIKTTTSEGVDKSTVNTYVNQASSLPALNQAQINAYSALLAQNNVASPIQVQQYEAGSTLLSTQRTTYKQESTRVLPELIQTAKAGIQNLEDRAVFEEYDAKGNPTLMSLKGGMKTKYLYNTRNQVIAKIENFTGTLDANTTTISGNPCTFINQYPNSLVTLFTYDAVTHLLIETMDSNCRKTTYVYDALHRLQQIKDHDGNVMKEFDTNYKPQ